MRVESDNSVNGDIKARLEALESLRNGAWNDYNTRRSYEWKIAISIWTALAAFIVAVLTGRIRVASGFVVFTTVTLTGVFIVLLHRLFVRGIAATMDVDRGKQFFFEAQILSILNLTLPQELEDKIKQIKTTKEKREKNVFLHWSQGFQLGVTLLLVIMSILGVFLVRNVRQ